MAIGYATTDGGSLLSSVELNADQAMYRQNVAFKRQHPVRKFKEMMINSTHLDCVSDFRRDKAFFLSRMRAIRREKITQSQPKSVARMCTRINQRSLGPRVAISRFNTAEKTYGTL